MKKIPLTQGKVALVDDEDYVLLAKDRWYAAKIHHTYYAVKRFRTSDFKRGTIRMHRVVLSAPDGMEVDHKNGNGLDNRRLNLRLCTCKENVRSRQLNSNNTTGFKGVVLTRRSPQKPYRAQVGVGNKTIHLGYHETARGAAQAYDAAAKEYFGEFALTNEVMGRL